VKARRAEACPLSRLERPGSNGAQQPSDADDPDAFRFYVARRVSNPSAAHFLFVTGIECRYRVVAGPDGKKVRRDQLRECGHNERWRENLEGAVPNAYDPRN
jgi:hypothetical protein